MAHLAGPWGGGGGYLHVILAACQLHLLAPSVVVGGLWTAPGLAGWLSQLHPHAAVWAGLRADHGWLAVVWLGGGYSLILKLVGSIFVYWEWIQLDWPLTWLQLAV